MASALAFGASTLDAPEAEAAKYSQVVDNTTKGRFAAPGWGTSSYASSRYGPNYRFTKPKANGKPARYKVKIPSTARYDVFARWPSDKGYNNGSRFAVRTSAGWKWKTVNQRVNGGKWVKLGNFRMKSGDNFSIRVARKSNGKGYIIADAVRVVQVAPKSGGNNGGGNNGGGGNKVTGAQVMREARTWLGVPYRYGGTTRNGVDCSGFTYAVYRKLGINLQRTAAAQFNNAPGKKVAKSQQRRGFLIFGNTGNQRGIQHVGILTGKKNTMIHAPYPGTVVREETFGGWYNSIGVKRIVSPA